MIISVSPLFFDFLSLVCPHYRARDCPPALAIGKGYQLHSKSTIQLVDEAKQKMREGIESLRTQQLKVEHGHKEINKDVNQTGIKTDDAIVTLPDGMYIV